MKLTQALYKIHLGRLIRRTWFARKDRKVTQTDTEDYLSSLGIQITDASKLIEPKKDFQKIDQASISFPVSKVIYDETHPDWKTRTCLHFGINNILQEGLSQAQILTNTICLTDFPSSIQNSLPDVPKYVDDIVERAIYNSTIFDAHQEKLPVRKNPEKLMWVYPRDYGLSNGRKMRNLSKKFLQICESISGPNIMKERTILYEEPMRLNFEKENDLIQFNIKLDAVVMSTNPLKPIENPENNLNINLPNIYPVHYTINLNKKNFYETEDIYPISGDIISPWKNIHTIFIHHNPRKVKNMTELPVTESQILSRTMINSYTAAASNARYKFGKSVKKLPEPITVQSVQTDGKHYQFFIFQLNSLDINNTSEKNFWYSLPPLTLYKKAQYDDGRPVVEGYNPEVFRQILAFYKNRN